MTRRPPWGMLIITLVVLGSSSHPAPAQSPTPARPWAPPQSPALPQFLAPPQFLPPPQSPTPAQSPAPAQSPTPAQPLAPAQPQARAQAQAGYSAAALYNLANAYARAGKPGLAVLNYERAMLLEPNDPDIDANLRHVRQAAGLPPESNSGFERMAGFASPRILAWLGVLGLLIAGAGVLARQSYPRHRRKLLAATLVGIFLLGLTVSNAIALWPIMHEAVVITPAAPVRVSPVPIEEPLFVLPEASIVRMSAEHDGFVLIQNKAGRMGWVQRTALAPIMPKQAVRGGKRG